MPVDFLPWRQDEVRNKALKQSAVYLSKSGFVYGFISDYTHTVFLRRSHDQCSQPSPADIHRPQDLTADGLSRFVVHDLHNSAIWICR